MRILILAVLTMAGCANVTAMIDEATGTTLAERCETRRAAIVMYDTLGRELSENEARVRADYQIYVGTVCPIVEAEPVV